MLENTHCKISISRKQFFNHFGGDDRIQDGLVDNQHDKLWLRRAREYYEMEQN